MLRDSWNRVKWAVPVKSVLKVSKEAKKRRWWGWDSEAYPNGDREGEPVLFVAVSEDGEWHYGSDPLEVLSHIRGDVFVWNITYEIGAFLRATKCTKEAWQKLRSKDSSWVLVSKKPRVEVRVFPARYMGVRYRGRVINFYDAFNFFGCGLDKAAKEFLGVGKKEFDFSWMSDGVEKIWDTLVEYCRQDAWLTVELMKKLRELAQELGFMPRSHYSPAAWAVDFFASRCGVENIKPVWVLGDEGKRVVEFAWDAYRGGKFEMTVLGYVEKAWMYDINSAYPAVIHDLYSLHGAKIVRSKLIHPEADYALIACVIEIPPQSYVYHPVGIHKNGILIFPAGRFLAVITKDEFDFLMRYGVNVEIIDAYWIYTTKRAVYRDAVEELYKIRREHPNEHVRKLAKIILNSFYGKMVQTVEDENGNLIPGMAWHPIYAGVITARVRCWVSELQNQGGILAVHTDSVISDRPLDLQIGDELGKWKLSAEGRYLGIREGLYQLGEKIAQRGYGEVRDWFEFLERCGETMSVKLSRKRMATWKEVELEKCNRFVHEDLELNFSKLQKRWVRERVTAKRLLEGRIETYPVLVWTKEVEESVLTKGDEEVEL